MKKFGIISSFVMAIAMLCLTLPMLANTKVYAEPVAVGVLFSGGDGSESEPYKISTKTDLVQLATLVNNTTNHNNFANKYLVLTKDIDMNGVNFYPIGWQQGYTFKGNFNGQGYSIKNLTMKSNDITPNNIANNCNWGLFGVIKAEDGVVITDFSLVDLDIEVSTPYITSQYRDVFAGGVVGYCVLDNTSNVSSTISKVAVRSGSIKALSKSSEAKAYIGGIVGSTSLRINSTDISTSNTISNSITVQYCYNNTTLTGSVQGTATLASNIKSAGIIGLGFINIDNCYSLKYKLFNDDIDPYGPELLDVAYSYYTLRSGMGNYNFYYWMDNTHKNVGGSGVLEGTTYTELKNHSNSSRKMWVLENPDNSKTDGIIVLMGVGNDLVQTTMTANTIEAYYDISNNATVYSAGTNIEYTLNQSVSYSAPDGKYRKYLSKVGIPYFKIEHGTSTEDITTSSFSITRTFIDTYDEGTLYKNSINGYPFKLNGVEYWRCTANNYIYTYANNIFSLVNIENTALYPGQNGKYLIGWSEEKPKKDICDYANKVISGVYNGWHCDYELAIKILRANMQSTNGENKNITGSEIVKTSLFTDNAELKLYPVYGDLKFRLYYGIYKSINSTISECDNVFINCDATKKSNYFRIESRTGEDYYTLSLINYLNTQILANNGYYSINWTLGTINPDTKVITPYTISSYGTLTDGTNSGFAISGSSVKLKSITEESSIIVLLTPRTDIGITISSNEFEGSENLVYKISYLESPAQLINNETKLIYGETYTITVENISDGWYLKKASVENATTPFTFSANTCTFIVDSNQDVLNITVGIFEGFFTGLLLDVIIAFIVVSLAILILSALINKYKPVEEYVVNSSLGYKTIARKPKKKIEDDDDDNTPTKPEPETKFTLVDE